jgi:methylmalonyl-CoA/ethylmalonyl-CoA epimerase
MNRPALIAQLGEIMQMAYVPRDFEQALRFWTKTLGARPFYSFEHVKLDRARYRGQPVEIDFSMMLGYWGNMQIELITQHNEAPSIFKTWRDDGHEGLHHVCMLVDDIDRARDLCNRARLQVAQEALVPGGGEVMYVDSAGGPASLLEILKPAPGTAEFFRMMREEHRTWDGSDPVRRVGR